MIINIEHKFVVEYEVLDPLPRWAYTDSEWSEMITSADKIVDGIMYQITEPEARRKI